MMTPPKKKGLWQPSNWYLAQVTHLLAGALIVLAADHQGWSMPWTLGIFWVVAAFKEFVIDLSPFEGDTVWGSAQDFFFYFIGSAAGCWTIQHFWAGVAYAAFMVVWLVLIDIHNENERTL